MKHECKYFLMDSQGVRRCVQCNKPAHQKDEPVEVKSEEAHEDKMLATPENKAQRARR